MEAVSQARERQEEARRLYVQKCERSAEAETIFIKDTLEKAEALEKHIKTVTMRARSLATTEVAPRPPGSAEAPDRAHCAVKPAQRHHPLHSHNRAAREKRRRK